MQATYQYPIPLPPARGGLAPNIDITYSSGALRGQMINKHSDHGEFGTGWSMGLAAISRDLMEVDQWGNVKHVDRFSLSIDGQNHQLLPVSGGYTSSERQFQVLNTPSLKVTMHKQSSAPNRDGIYWKVYKPDGTVLRLGYTADSEILHDDYEYQRNVVHLAEGGHPTWAGDHADESAFRWNVDTVTDVHGNQIQYDYYKYLVSDQDKVKTYGSRIHHIRYNYAALAANPDTRLTGNNYGTRIDFDLRAIYHSSTEDHYRVIDEIKIYHLDFSKPLRKIAFDQSVYAKKNGWSTNCQLNGGWETPSVTVMLNKIRPYDWNNAAEPDVRLDYRPIGHGEGNYGGCFLFYYLRGVRSELGAYTHFEYTTDSKFLLWQGGSILDIEGVIYVWQGSGIIPESSIVQSHMVSKVEHFDGVRGWKQSPLHASNGQYAVTEYSYSQPCYNYAGSNDQLVNQAGGMSGAIFCKTQQTYSHGMKYGVGTLVGFHQVTVKQKDYNGSVLGETRSYYHRQGFGSTSTYGGFQMLLVQGKPYRQRAYTADGAILAETNFTYTTQDSGARPYFTPLTQECSYTYSQYSTNASAMSAQSRCQTHKYELSYQNSWVPSSQHIQYGNKSRTIETSDIGGRVRTIETRNYYRPNRTKWIINLPLAQYTLEDGQYISRVLNDYDGSYGTEPTKGLHTRVRAKQSANGSWITQQTMTYDAYGNVQYVYDALGKRTDTTYDSVYHLYPVRTNNSLGHYELYKYTFVEDANYNTLDDGPPGLLRDHRGVDGVYTYYLYDNRARLKRVINGWVQQGSSSSKPSVFYDYYDGIDSNGDGKLDGKPWTLTWTKTQDNATNYSVGGTHAYEIYDGQGRVVQTQMRDNNWNGSSHAWHTVVADVEYNARGEVRWQSNPYRHSRASAPAASALYVTPNSGVPRTWSKYDAQGNVIRVHDPNNIVVESIYGQRAAYGLDGREFISASYFDAVGQLIAVDEPLAKSTDSFGGGVGSSWQKVGNVTGVGGWMRVSGAGDWNDYAANALDSDLDHGVQFKFKATNNARGSLFINDGGHATNGSAYHRIGLKLENNVLTAAYFQQGQAQSVPTAQKTLLTITPNKAYYVLLRGAQDSNADWTILVWEEDNASKRAEIRVAKGGTWDTSDWRFVAQMRSGSVDIDNYREYEFNRTEYEYDGLGNLTEVTNPLGHKTTMTYNWWGHKLTMDDPDMGNWVVYL